MRNQVGQVWKQQVGYFNALLEENSLGQSPDLLKAIQHQVMSGGKRLRASIPSFILQYLGQVTGRSLLGQEEDSAKWLGLCAELLHSATLCHDDLMDGDRTRRNSPTVWVTYGAPQAINAGDLLFYVGEEAIHRSPLSAEMKLLALKYVARCMSIVIHGQALEIELRRDKILPDLKSYESVVVGKTGGLFSLCLVFGGIAAGLSPQELNLLEGIGMWLGQSFQIQDDIIDLLGDKGRGMPGSDLWEGKPSWLVAYAATHFSESFASPLDAPLCRELSSLLYIPREDKTEEDVRQIYLLLEKGRAIAAGRQYLADFQVSRSGFQESWKPYSGLIDGLLGLIERKPEAKSEAKSDDR